MRNKIREEKMIEDRQCNKKQQWNKFTRLTRLE